ncbi:MAG: RelA/SpoT family protein [Candidatus Aminicenantia bacterium]
MVRFDDILEKILIYSPKSDLDLLRKAYVFAAKAHKGQVRLSGEPYLNHPLEVTNMLADMKLDEITLAAGLLHDVLEDTDITLETLRELFGEEVTHLVEGVTKISRIKFTSPEEHQAENIRKVILAMIDDLRVIFIKLADRVHNLKTLKFQSEEKQLQIAKETLEIYAPIANRLGMGKIKAELEDLSFRYIYQEDYFWLLGLVEERKEKSEKKLKKIKKELEKLLTENNLSAQIFYRLKRLYSIFNKMKRQNIEFNQVFDFMALRIITTSIRDCYATLGLIHQKWTPLPGRFKDFIAVPKPNLYRALHTTIITPDKQTFEIQIRTEEMHQIAENGIAAHWRYKDKEDFKEDKRVKWLRELVELYREQKSPREFLKNLKTDLHPEEIYVFTPKGMVISLPVGSTPIDFAYQIHTEIGNHCIGAKINGKLSSLKTILQIGDIVEILTSPSAGPSRDWLSVITTPKARNSIKHWLKVREREKSITLGKKIWEKELKKYKKILPQGLKEKELLTLLSRLKSRRFQKINDFFAAIGYGTLVINKKLMASLFSSEKIEEKKAIPFPKETRKLKIGIKVRGYEDLLVYLAKCCSPIKGEEIIGYITRGKGVAVHSLRCPYITKEILDSNRMIEVSWDIQSDSTYSARLSLQTEDKRGVLAKITSIIANLESNIKKAGVNTFSDKRAQVKLLLEIKDMNQLNLIIQKLKEIKEVIDVQRL